MIRKEVKVWHGTPVTRLNSIMKKGLIPNYLPPPGGTSGNTKNAIYLFKNENDAKAQMKLLDNMVLLEITIPNNCVKNLIEGEEAYELIYKGTILPQFIKQKEVK